MLKSEKMRVIMYSGAFERTFRFKFFVTIVQYV